MAKTKPAFFSPYACQPFVALDFEVHIRYTASLVKTKSFLGPRRTLCGGQTIAKISTDFNHHRSRI